VSLFNSLPGGGTTVRKDWEEEKELESKDYICTRLDGFLIDHLPDGNGLGRIIEKKKSGVFFLRGDGVPAHH